MIRTPNDAARLVYPNQALLVRTNPTPNPESEKLVWSQWQLEQLLRTDQEKRPQNRKGQQSK